MRAANPISSPKMSENVNVKATHRSSTSAAQHKTQANVRQTDEKMEEVR